MARLFQKHTLFIAFVLTLVIAIPLTSSASQRGTILAPQAATSSIFTETFDAAPTAPSRWDPPGWDVIRSGNASQAPFTNPIPDCNGTQSYAPMADNEEFGVYKCPNHLMLRMANLSYGFMMLTPPTLVDFSNGEAAIQWDMSTINTNGRNWIEMHLMPVQDHILMAAERWGSNRAARELVIMSKEGSCSGTKNTSGEGSVLIKTEIRRVLSGNYSGDEQIGQACLGDYVNPSGSTYTTLEFRITKTHLKFGIPSQNAWFFDKQISDLGWDKGVLQFGVSAYNSHSNSPCFESGACPFTVFHFDNVTISPSIPFTILKGDRSFINSTTTNQWNLTTAPSGALLKFVGIANKIEVSFNDGTSWTRVPLANQPSNNPEGDEHGDDYLTALPQGTTKVLFRGERWWGGDWEVDNIGVYAFNTSPTISPTSSLKLGDINHDGSVNILDYSILFENYGLQPLLDQRADIMGPNGVLDGQVNILDYAVLFEQYGS
jgi:hypothetical protein